MCTKKLRVIKFQELDQMHIAKKMAMDILGWWQEIWIPPPSYMYPTERKKRSFIPRDASCHCVREHICKHHWWAFLGS